MTPLTEEQRTLGLEIRDLEVLMQESSRRLRSLRSRLNNIAWINHLPPELLSQIFSWCLPAVATGDMTRTEVAPSGIYEQYPILAVTHVCQQWREVALTAPFLWSRIKVTGRTRGARLLDAFLLRAKNTPLELEAENLAPIWMYITRKIAQPVIRSKVLSLTLSSTLIDNVVGDLPRYAPLLEKLFLRDAGPNQNGLNCPFLPEAFLRMHLPVLSELSIKDYYIPWSRTPFPQTLTRLSISGGFGLERYIGNYSDIIPAISHLYMLEHLTLEDAFFAPPPNRTFDVYPLVLPRLRSVFVSGDPRHAAVFLSSCELYPWIQISQETINLSEAEALSLVTPLIHVVTPCLPVEYDGEMRYTVCALSCQRNFIQFYTSLREDPGVNIEESCHPYFRFAFPERHAKQGILLISGLPLHDIKVLKVNCSSYTFSSMDTWKDALGNMRGIEYLDITNHDGDCRADAIISLLWLNSTQVDEPVSQSYLMPKMKYLRLAEVDFVLPGEESSNTFVTALCDVLKQREDAGCKVFDLVLEKCFNLDRGDIAMLEGVVRVTWDGHGVRRNTGFEAHDDAEPELEP